MTKTGAGVAGGTMLIAGGGALLGAIGGSGVSAVTSMTLATGGSYVLDECAKLTAFCEEVLIERYEDYAAVAMIHSALNQRIVELEVEIESLKLALSDDGPLEGDDEERDGAEEVGPQKMVKILNRSLKFMRRSSDELAKQLREAGKKHKALPVSR